MKVRKKPVVVDADQWFPHKPVDGVEYPTSRCLGEYGFIETLEGGYRVSPGDWIITGVKGEKYAVKPDIYEETYETVEMPSDSGSRTRRSYHG